LKKALPVFLLVTTPFLGALPASFPDVLLKGELSFIMISLPEILTFLEPSLVSLDTPVLGYGIGIPGGVAGVCGGVKHTSGKAAMLLPSAALQEISRPLA